MTMMSKAIVVVQKCKVDSKSGKKNSIKSINGFNYYVYVNSNCVITS